MSRQAQHSMTSQPRTRRLATIALILVGGLCLCASGVWLYRKPLFHWAAQAYFASKDLQLEFNIQELSWREIYLTNIKIEDGIFIPKLHVVRSSESPQIAGIQTVDVDVQSIDVRTTQKMIAAFTNPVTDDTPTPLPQFNELKDHCARLRPTTVRLNIHTLVHENTTVPLNMRLVHEPGSNVTEFSFSGDKLNFTNNDRFTIKTDAYSGKMELVCEDDKITVIGEPVHIAVRAITLQEPFFELTDSRLVSSKLWVSVDAKSSASIHVPLEFKISARTKTQKIRASLPSFLATGTHSLDGTQKSALKIVAKNISVTSPHAVDVKNVAIDVTTPFDYSGAIHGEAKVSGLTYKDQKLKPLIRNISTTAHFQKTPESSTATLTVTDPTGNLAFKNIQLLQTGSAITADFKKKSSQMHLNSRIAELVPPLKDSIKTLSGTLTFDGLVTYKNDAISGGVEISGQSIAVTSGYGDASDINFSHDILDLETMASSPGRKLTIEKVVVGKVFKNIALTYHVKNKSHIAGERLRFNHEGALIETGAFWVNPLKKELNGFKAKVSNLKLDTLLSMMVGPFITADGTLSGTIDLELQDKIPTLAGTLKADQPGWIHYRKQGDQQQKTIYLSDTPMTILNSYLYNFHYKQLDMEIHTNKQYEMAVLLAAFGHNPDYLKGKPLKLKINLEQNVLGAIQSMMLSYDLPGKLKEKLEKAGN